MADNNDGVLIGLDAAKRFARTTLRVENMPQPRADVPTTVPTFLTVGFYAKITAKKPSDHRYSWEMLQWTDPDDSLNPDEWEADTTKVIDRAAYNDSDDRFAVEALYRSAWVPVGSIVWMRKPMNQPYYVFDYEGRVRIGKVGATEIEGRDGTTVHYGNGYIYERASTTLSPDNEQTETVRFYNMLKLDVAADAYVIVQMIEGVWTIIAEDCES